MEDGLLELELDVYVEVPVPVLVARVRRMPILLDGVGPKADTTMDVSVEAPSTRSASKESGCIFLWWVEKDVVEKLLGIQCGHQNKIFLSLGSLLQACRRAIIIISEIFDGVMAPSVTRKAFDI